MRVITTILILFGHISFSNTLGLDVMLVSKEKGENQIYYNEFSRNFCNFLCGPDAYKNSEFEQIQKLTDLSLNLFRNYPVNLEPDTSELEYKLYLAEEENNLIKIEQLKNKIKNTVKKWEQNYYLINDGWIKVSDLKELTEKLISKLKEKSIHKALKYNFNWENYFKNEVRKSKDKLSYLDHTLIEDLNSLLKGLEIMSQRGITYVAFSYG
ncbi:hypothetical protein [Seonamhaeicola marinus]|uniref:Uncharacterized protein n=1 Tax=Seonamhaeicola marinus TaxID=1912246 RepID=A0A5D0I4M5_9FLAO|nr:hypothetical protein [Seonamhaeicola marinus]TYA78624.1 hypothetical protein FUA24_09740 [Seonamhaeicola marinus]